jgi:hypothetical protein
LKNKIQLNEFLLFFVLLKMKIYFDKKVLLCAIFYLTIVFGFLVLKSKLFKMNYFHLGILIDSCNDKIHKWIKIFLNRSVKIDFINNTFCRLVSQFVWLYLKFLRLEYTKKIVEDETEQLSSVEHDIELFNAEIDQTDVKNYKNFAKNINLTEIVDIYKSLVVISHRFNYLLDYFYGKQKKLKRLLKHHNSNSVLVRVEFDDFMDTLATRLKYSKCD